MIFTIGEILKSKLIGFTYVDRIAGIVTTGVKKDANGAIVRFPIACDVDGIECDDTGRINDLIPNDIAKSVLYFEDLGGSQFNEKSGNDLKFTTNIRLVGWLNLALLGKDNCSVTAQVVAHIMTRLESTNEVNPIPFTRLKIAVIGQVQRTPQIFARYTYQETQTQYLMFPFDYFAIDFRVTYSINKNCVPEFNAGDPDECLIK
jgi:hypothetical protein